MFPLTRATHFGNRFFEPQPYGHGSKPRIFSEHPNATTKIDGEKQKNAVSSGSVEPKRRRGSISPVQYPRAPAIKSHKENGEGLPTVVTGIQ